MDNLDSWQGNCCQRHPTAGSLNIMSSLVLPSLTTVSPLHAENSPRGPRIETFGSGFKTLRLLSFFKFYASTGDIINQSFTPGKSTFFGPKLWRKIARTVLKLCSVGKPAPGVLSLAPRQTQHFPAKRNWFDRLHTGSFSGLHCVPPADTWLHFWSKSLTSLKFTKQGGHWGFIKYWPPKKKP